MQKYGWLMFVAGAILTWGAYVVTIDHGRNTMAGTAHGAQARRPARGRGDAGVPVHRAGVLRAGRGRAGDLPGGNKVDRAPWPDDPGFIQRGVVLSTLAGVLGAAGALCIVFAVGAARRTMGANGAAYVAPLVFCFAPIVNVLISMVIEPPANAPDCPGSSPASSWRRRGRGWCCTSSRRPHRRPPRSPPRSHVTCRLP